MNRNSFEDKANVDNLLGLDSKVHLLKSDFIGLSFIFSHKLRI